MDDLSVTDVDAFFEWDTMDVYPHPDNPPENPAFADGNGSTTTAANTTPPWSPSSQSTPVVYNSQSNFLDLPYEIKVRILGYAGLLRPSVIDISAEKARVKDALARCLDQQIRNMRNGSGTSSQDPAIPTNLFLTNRVLREEVGRLFFALNKFSLSVFTKSDFKSFNDSFEWGFEGMRHLHLNLGPKDQRYLKLGVGVHRAVMNTWGSFCNVATQSMPNLTNFTLKCKVKDSAVAAAIFAGMDGFPKLSHCAIQLNHLSHEDMVRQNIPHQDLIRQTKQATLKATSRTADQSFPFFSLPKELQAKILEYALVDRSDPFVVVDRQEPFVPNDTSCRHLVKGVVGLLDRKRYRTGLDPHFACCGTCSPTGDTCFCPTNQAAFSTSCTCFTPPTPYFLVSREFYETARWVFFSKNTFALLDNGPESMMRAINCIPTDSFKMMRKLVFRFPLENHVSRNDVHVEDPTNPSWLMLRRFIREHFDLPRLSLFFIDYGGYNLLTMTTGGHRKSVMRRLSKSFKDMRGLRDYRVFLGQDRNYEKEAERIVLRLPREDQRPQLPSLPYIGQRHLEKATLDLPL
ncbi:Endonuclease III-like protein 1 [Aspergillus nanangensis]|uniref:Endonuclease III-like protein 1 n=1 Tax=Aspergillus nanangensis TaxID=2582783 RepID=A0AAD4CK65_ASPNN|nr:Endonuclease III-like protein 1 [Aspergillus nanangensis]